MPEFNAATTPNPELEAVRPSLEATIAGIRLQWQSAEGTCTFAHLPVACMWIDTTLAGLMSGVQAMVGSDRFSLALQSEGRKSVQADWEVISRSDSFEDGFRAIATVAAVAGWGEWRLTELDLANRGARFRVRNSWEGRYQKALNVCWGSSMLAGKLAGYCSRLFSTNCWAEQTRFIARGDEADEFQVVPSSRSIENEIDGLLHTDAATRADMATALKKLEDEIQERVRTEAELRSAEMRIRQAATAGNLGLWDWNLCNNQVYYSPEWKRQIGWEDDEIQSDFNEWQSRVHPDDLTQALDSVTRFREGRLPRLEIEFRLRHKDDSYRWILAHAALLHDSQGVAHRMLGSHLDITERKLAQEALEKSLSLLQSVIEHAPVRIFWKDTNLRYLGCNALFAADASAATPEELIGKCDYDMPWREEAELYRADDRSILETGINKLRYEERQPQSGGRILLVRTSKVRLQSKNGKTVGILGIYEDITDRKQAEIELQTSHSLLAATLESTTDGILVVDSNGRVAGFNRRFLELWHIPESLATTRDDARLLQFVLDQLRDAAGFMRKVEELYLNPESSSRDEVAFLDGRIFERYSLPQRIENRVVGRVWSFRDITERRRAETAATAAHERAAILAQLSRELAETATPKAAALSILMSAKRLLGWDCGWLRLWDEQQGHWTGLVVFDVMDGECREIPVDPITTPDGSPLLSKAMNQAQLLLRRDESDGEQELTRFGSGRRSLSLMFAPMRAAGRLIGMLSIQSYERLAFDASGLSLLQSLADHCAGALERIRTTAALAEREANFRSLTEESLVGVFVVSADQFRYVNATHAGILGGTPEELMALPSALATFCERDRERITDNFRRRLAGEPVPSHHETCVQRKDGERRLLELLVSATTFAGEPAILGTTLDVTERKRIETQMLRKQRLESIGTLAGGVAHDLNNALAPILMVTQLMRTDYPQAQAMLDLVETSVRRGADMVRQLLTFARGVEGERLSIQAAHLLKELERIVEGTFPKNIRLESHISTDLPRVLGDATQLHQVLLNLCVNARDAMPIGGKLTLEARAEEIDAVTACSIPDAKPGLYVVLRVHDTGIGIPAELLERVFDPFFTTKGPDKGTGLGLSTALGIVKSHGGFMRVNSQPRLGSVFAVYLPVQGISEDAEVAAAAPDLVRGNGEVILFVDDESSVREAASIALRRLNYNPLSAADGAEGARLVELHRSEIRLIITDLHMPRMDGLTFARMVHWILPETPILIASGRIDDSMTAELRSAGIADRLDKPFTASQLSQALARHLRPGAKK